MSNLNEQARENLKRATGLTHPSQEGTKGDIWFYPASFLYNKVASLTNDVLNPSTFWGNVAKRIEHAWHNPLSADEGYDSEAFSHNALVGIQPSDPRIKVGNFAKMISDTAKNVVGYDLQGEELNALQETARAEIEGLVGDVGDSTVFVVSNFFSPQSIRLPQDEMLLIREYEAPIDEKGHTQTTIDFASYKLANTVGWLRELGEGITLNESSMKFRKSEFSSQADFLQRHANYRGVKQIILVSEQALKNSSYHPNRLILQQLPLENFHMHIGWDQSSIQNY